MLKFELNVALASFPIDAGGSASSSTVRGIAVMFS
jgi:hypothetical protein